MTIRHWPEAERPREKLRLRGPAALSDAELLAICLRHGVDGESAVLEESYTRRARAELHAIAELGRRMLAEAVQRGEVFSDPGAVRRFLLGQLRDLRHEVFACLFLDSRHRLIAFERLFRGTIDGASVHPREVVQAALLAEPSRADVRITGRLKSALELVDVRVLDHMVVGDTEVVSLAERGLL